MSDADLLREAATKIRRGAEAATPGPWRPAAEMVKTGGITDVRFVAEAYGLADKWPNAEHIAMWDPPAAMAVADLLEAQAKDYESYGPRVFDHVHRAAMALARAYLGRCAVRGLLIVAGYLAATALAIRAAIYVGRRARRQDGAR